MAEPLLRVEHLTKHFPVTRGLLGKVVGQVRAVDDVSFHINPGETVGLVGESGCGKTTVGRALLRLVRPTSGRVLFDGKDFGELTARQLLVLRRGLQIVFQDPFGSLNPRMRVIDLVGEALRVHRIARGPELARQVVRLLALVGIPKTALNRYPHEFSGGQRQRIGIARALALGPKLIVCDEAVSALDVSIRAQVLNLLIDLRKKLGLAYLFISHDLSVVRHISDRVLVMYLGEVVESAPCDELFGHPAHPYTHALLSAIPVPDPRRRRAPVLLEGDLPSPADPPGGCRFHTRCPVAMSRCTTERPEWVALDEGHSVRCHHADSLAGRDDWADLLQRRIGEQGGGVSTRAGESSTATKRPEPMRPRPGVAASGPSARARAFAAAAVVVGASLALSGAVALGVAVVLVAWRSLATLRGAPARASLRLAVPLVGLVVALGVGSKSKGARVSHTHELRWLRTQIEGYRRTMGEYPGELADLGWRLFDGPASVRSTDRGPLGYRYRRTKTGYRLERLPLEPP